LKVLFLVQHEQRAILDRLYDGVAKYCDCDLRRLSSWEQAHLRDYFLQHVDTSRYDRIVLFLRFKKIIRQVFFTRSIPNLVLLEHDACQNYISTNKYNGKFSAYYRRVPWARIISSGAMISERLRKEGFDAVFVSKGYDEVLLSDMGHQRNIELGFLGSINNEAYRERRALLEELGQVENLLVTRTNSGEDYLNTLNRIRFFVSADIGHGEYMLKNFEAMACGCVLLAYNQGEFENHALGFLDMQNIVLYRDISEFRHKLQILRENPDLAAQIAHCGRELAESRFKFQQIGQQIVEAMKPPLRAQEPPGWLERLWRQVYL
jgi:glycosyltransferase involved in cell wall biosynthesis